ncbi:MAG: hypothetical protein COB67_02835 [SAR324 cluster bacterium]|uniref:CARDB domain-containing protein n=1 Tax=SAR324 cluster bacterium TaxID=2024889 RepID=A0A2A4T9I4_9DELT|nr:MAG: hypothetical protein COB67_02835 [SAR324 cluster bacterium]
MRLSWCISLFFSLVIFFLLDGAPLQAATQPIAASGLMIQSIIVGEDSIQTKRTQLIEVVIRNINEQAIPIRIKLVITLPNRNIITFGNKRILAKGKTESRALFDYKIARHLGGDYTVGAKVYSTRGKVLAATIKKQGRYFFAIDPLKTRRAPSRVKRRQALENVESINLARKKTNQVALLFDPPDLVWEEMKIINKTSVLRGETTHIRMVLANQGGNVATNVEYSIKWFFAQREKRKKRLFWDKIKAIAPGERKVIELPITIPEVEQRGEYLVEAVVDEPNYVKESEENNNTKVISKPIIFSDVALVFPEEGYSFAEDGLFKFQWRSRRYRQFKVQISADPTFKDEENLFELPKGQQWTPAVSIKPMRGELPGLALALMDSNDLDHLFWRVKAKDQAGKVTFSTGRKFFINLKADYEQ